MNDVKKPTNIQLQFEFIRSWMISSLWLRLNSGSAFFEVCGFCLPKGPLKGPASEGAFVKIFVTFEYFVVLYAKDFIFTESLTSIKEVKSLQ